MPGACVTRGNSALQLPGCVPCISTLASLRPSPLISLNGGVARMSHGPRGVMGPWECCAFCLVPWALPGAGRASRRAPTSGAW